MFKLIFFLVGLAVAIVFSALNLGNVTDVSLGFAVLKDMPVFLTALVSFLAGAVFTLPFAFSVSYGNRKKKNRPSSARFSEDEYPDQFEPAETKNETTNDL